jgi:hypothetical protein
MDRKFASAVRPTLYDADDSDIERDGGRDLWMPTSSELFGILYGYFAQYKRELRKYIYKVENAPDDLEKARLYLKAQDRLIRLYTTWLRMSPGVKIPAEHARDTNAGTDNERDRIYSDLLLFEYGVIESEEKRLEALEPAPSLVLGAESSFETKIHLSDLSESRNEVHERFPHLKRVAMAGDKVMTGQSSSSEACQGSN